MTSASIMAGIASWVESNASLSAIIGEGSPVSNWRYYMDDLPTNPTYPCLVGSQVSDNSDANHDPKIGLRRARVQFDAYAETPAEAEDLIETLLEQLIENFNGTMGNFTGVSVFDEGRNPSQNFTDSKSLRTVVHRSRDFMFEY